LSTYQLIPLFIDFCAILPIFGRTSDYGIDNETPSMLGIMSSIKGHVAVLKTSDDAKKLSDAAD